MVLITVFTYYDAKLLSVARYRNQSPYLLVAPTFQSIAPFLISRLCDQPSLLPEACRFISIRPHYFIVRNLRRTLPILFAEAQGKVLNAIAQETGQKLSTLFLNHSHEILARILRIQAPAHSTKALQFIIDILREAAGDSRGSIDIPSVIRSCIIPLLAELVICLGDDNVDEVSAVSHVICVCSCVGLS